MPTNIYDLFKKPKVGQAPAPPTFPNQGAPSPTLPPLPSNIQQQTSTAVQPKISNPFATSQPKPTTSPVQPRQQISAPATAPPTPSPVPQMQAPPDLANMWADIMGWSTKVLGDLDPAAVNDPRLMQTQMQAYPEIQRRLQMLQSQAGKMNITPDMLSSMLGPDYAAMLEAVGRFDPDATQAGLNNLRPGGNPTTTEQDLAPRTLNPNLPTPPPGTPGQGGVSLQPASNEINPQDLLAMFLQFFPGTSGIGGQGEFNPFYGVGPFGGFNPFGAYNPLQGAQAFTGGQQQGQQQLGFDDPNVPVDEVLDGNPQLEQQLSASHNSLFGPHGGYGPDDQFYPNELDAEYDYNDLYGVNDGRGTPGIGGGREEGTFYSDLLPGNPDITDDGSGQEFELPPININFGGRDGGSSSQPGGPNPNAQSPNEQGQGGFDWQRALIQGGLGLIPLLFGGGNKTPGGADLSGTVLGPLQNLGGVGQDLANHFQAGSTVPANFDEFFKQLTGQFSQSPLGNVTNEVMGRQLGGGAFPAQLGNSILSQFQGGQGLQDPNNFTNADPLTMLQQQLRSLQQTGFPGQNIIGDPARMLSLDQGQSGLLSGFNDPNLQSNGILGSLNNTIQNQGMNPEFINAAMERILQPQLEAQRGQLNAQGGGVAAPSSGLFQELERRTRSDFGNDLILNSQGALQNALSQGIGLQSDLGNQNLNRFNAVSGQGLNALQTIGNLGQIPFGLSNQTNNQQQNALQQALGREQFTGNFGQQNVMNAQNFFNTLANLATGQQTNQNDANLLNQANAGTNAQNWVQLLEGILRGGGLI